MRQTIPKEKLYADIALIGTNHTNVRDIENILQNHNLEVNVKKTEHVTIRMDIEMEGVNILSIENTCQIYR